MSLEQELNEYKLDLLENTKYFTIEELAQMYQRAEISIYYNFHMDAQWDKKKQDKLIKNILIGFPVPTIFVKKMEEENTWLVLDGYNRLSTIFGFLGILRDSLGTLYSNNVYKVNLFHPKIPSLKDTTWDNGGKRLSKKLKEKFLNYRIPVYFIK